jgi:hypothetical protein
MGLIEWYCLFALATALTSYYELFNPVLQQLEVAQPENNLVTTKFLSFVIFVGGAFLIAPLLVLPCIHPKSGETFRKALFETLLDKDTKI